MVNYSYAFSCRTASRRRTNNERILKTDSEELPNDRGRLRGRSSSQQKRESAMRKGSDFGGRWPALLLNPYLLKGGLRLELVEAIECLTTSKPISAQGRIATMASGRPWAGMGTSKPISCPGRDGDGCWGRGGSSPYSSKPISAQGGIDPSFVKGLGFLPHWSKP